MGTSTAPQCRAAHGVSGREPRAGDQLDDECDDDEPDAECCCVSPMMPHGTCSVPVIVFPATVAIRLIAGCRPDIIESETVDAA